MQVVGVSILVNLAVGITVSLVLFSCAHPILRLMGLTAELMQDGMDYMRIVGAFAFFQALSLTLSASPAQCQQGHLPDDGHRRSQYPQYHRQLLPHLRPLRLSGTGRGRRRHLHSLQPGCLHDYTVRHTVPQAHPPFPTGILPPFPWIELKNLMKVGLPSAGEQLSYSSSQVVITYFINMLGSGSARHPYLLCQHHHVRLSVQHLHGTRRRHLYRASDRREETSRSLPYGKIRHEEIRHDYRHAVLHPRPFGHAIFGWLTSNPDIIRMGATILIIDVLLEIGRPINICHQRPSCGRRCQLPLLRRVGGAVECSCRCGIPFGFPFGWGICGMWVAFLLDENIRGFIFVRRWYGMKWVNKSFIRS